MRGHRTFFGFVLLTALSASPLQADDVSTAVFMRTDSDGTQVVSPSADVRLDLHEGDTHMELGYAMDIWTSASIDIRTAATRPVTEQRDELRVGIEHEREDTTLLASYRFSSESDYQSHSGSITVDRRLAGGSANFTGSLFAAGDQVGRSGDNDFARDLATLGGRATFTQIIDRRSLLQGTYELARREGYQSSPYRFVGVGGDGSCGGASSLCLPEVHPEVRLRHSFVLRGRRALADEHSLGVSYRFYLDSWGIRSHTGIAQWGWSPSNDTTFLARYRFYQQGAADSYQARYTDAGAIPELRSRDRELSPMRHHRLMLSLEHQFEITDSGPTTRVTIGLGGTILQYANFIGLDQVYGADLVLSGVVDL